MRCCRKGWRCNYEVSRRCGPRGSRKQRATAVHPPVDTSICYESLAASDVFRDFTWIQPPFQITEGSPVHIGEVSMLSPGTTEPSETISSPPFSTSSLDMAPTPHDWMDATTMFGSPGTGSAQSEENSPIESSSPLDSSGHKNCIDDDSLTSFDALCKQPDLSCDCRNRLLQVLGSTCTSSAGTPPAFLAESSKTKVLGVAAELLCCGCYVSNDALLYLLLYAITEVLAKYATEANRLSFEGSTCVNHDGQKEVERVAQATIMFGELSRASHIIDSLAKQMESCSKRTIIDDLQHKFGETRRAVWASLRPLTVGWVDLLAHE